MCKLGAALASVRRDDESVTEEHARVDYTENAGSGICLIETFPSSSTRRLAASVAYASE